MAVGIRLHSISYKVLGYKQPLLMTGFHVVQASLRLTVEARTPLNFWACPLPKVSDYKHASSCLVYIVLGMKFWALCIVHKHSTKYTSSSCMESCQLFCSYIKRINLTLVSSLLFLTAKISSEMPFMSMLPPIFWVIREGKVGGGLWKRKRMKTEVLVLKARL